MKQLENIEDKLDSLGRTFVGTTEMQYPTYMVHLDFLKPNDDPMYPIDWAIIHFIKDMPKVDKTSVAKIIGLERSLIDYRIKLLCEFGDLEYNQNYGEFQVTEKGKEDYFAPDGSTMYVYSSKDLLIDGNSLSIMDYRVYNNRLFINGRNKSADIIENVTVTKDGKPIRNLLKSLEKMTNTNKEKLLIPADSKDFSTSDDPTYGSITINFVFSIDKFGNVYKNIFCNDDFINIPFYSENINSFYYGRNVKFNYGFTNYEDKDLKNLVFDFTHETICNILKDLYKWNFVDESFYIYTSRYDLYKRPLTVNVNLKNFLSCHEKNSLKKDLKKGEVYYIIGDKTLICLSVVSKDSALKELLAFEETMDNIYLNQGLEKLVDWLCEKDFLGKRKKLIDLERFDILEKIDNYIFIQSN